MSEDDKESIIRVVVFITGLLLISYFACFVHAEPVKNSMREARVYPQPPYKIVILDSGYDPARAPIEAKLCKTGHRDMATRTNNINYVHPHGTKVASIIAEKLKDVDYCLIIMQIFTDGKLQSQDEDIAQVINDAIGLGATAINVSIGGNRIFRAERDAFINVSKTGIPVFLAAGNQSHNLDENCNFYPACYKFKNFVVAGMVDDDYPKQRAKVSNYGKLVDIWAPGYYRLGEVEEWEHGTSFAAPRALADYILFLEHKRLAALKKK